MDVHDKLPAKAYRKRTVHGATVGIMMLETGMQRFPGDVGFAGTFRFPVQYVVVRGATSTRVVKPNADNMLELFKGAVDELVAIGVDGISTSCGFLAIMQRELAAYSPVPVATSALLQVRLIQNLLPKGQRVGVITANRAALTPAHLEAVDCPLDTPIVGLPTEAYIRQNDIHGVPVIDRSRQEADVVALALKLVEEHANIGAIVMECTNFAPYSALVEARTGLPVYNINTMIEWFHAGLRPFDWSRYSG